MPPSARALLREPSKLVYRAVRDAGPAGLEVAEVCDLTGLERSRVFACLIWMRSVGVDIRAARDPGAFSRFVLGSLLPESWDGVI